MSIVLCVDMDAFFASVEQKSNPSLRGKPIAVVGAGKRTVVTTASYEARAFGVKTGMNVWEARKACPSLILVTGNNEKYTHTARVLAEIFSGFTPEMEVYSIDEAFLDITTTHHLFGGPEQVGRLIKQAVFGCFGIRCTVGIAPNVQMAKLASDLGKPDGLMRIGPDEVAGVLEDLPVKKLWGIGGKTSEKLAAMGITTCGQLGRTPPGLLRSRFGIFGEALSSMGAGRFNRVVQTEQADVKSIGHSMTLPEDLGDRAEINLWLLKLSEMVGRRARKHGYMGGKLTLVVRYSDFHTFSRQAPMGKNGGGCLFTNDTRAIHRRAVEILSGVRLRDRVRLLGVSLCGLVRDPGQLFLMPDERKSAAVLHAMDRINDRYGEFNITWGALKPTSPNGRQQGVISPAWRPSGVRDVDIK